MSATQPARPLIDAAIEARATTLTLRGHALTEDDVAAIGTMDWLEALDLGNTRLPYRALEPLGSLTRLRWIDLINMHPPQDVLQSILPRMVSLETINYLGTPLSGDTLRAMSVLPKLRAINGGHIRASTDAIEGLTTLPALEEVSLYAELGDIHIALFPALKRVRHLHLWNAKLTDFTPLSEMPALQLLHLQSIAPIKSWKSLATLKRLRGLKAGNAGSACLRYASKLPALELLTFEQYKRSADAALKWIPKLPALRHLGIDYAQKTTDAGMAHLGQATALRSLSLGTFRCITDAGMHHIAGLTALEELNISMAGRKVTRGFWETNVTDAGLAALKGMTKLQTLNLSYTGLSDAGAGFLHGMPDLTHLNLSSTRITERSLAGLPCLPKLQLLAARATRVGPGVLPILKQCGALKGLHLHFKDDDAAQAELAALREPLSDYNGRFWADAVVAEMSGRGPAA